MGNLLITENKKIVNIKKREYNLIDIVIPYNQLTMIKVLQEKFDYEVKGTIYVDANNKFKSFEVRTDNSETYSYGSADWRISFHTHPDNTAQKYGIRYFSPPSVDDIMEIYDHCMRFVPITTKGGFGEISIIFCNEGIYVLQSNRNMFIDFNKQDLPLDGLEALLEGTFTQYMVDTLKTTLRNNNNNIDINMDTPDITYEAFTVAVKAVCTKVTENYGLNMVFYSWPEIEKNGLSLRVYDYFLTKGVQT